MRRRRALAALVAVALGALARGEELPDGVGVATPKGSVFSTSLTAGDDDDYVFAGMTGMTWTARLTPLARTDSTGDVVVRLFRPDGSNVNQNQGLDSRFGAGIGVETVRFPLDATGTWKARVFRLRFGGPEPEYPYALTMRTGKPRLPAETRSAPDANRQFRFTIPAQGGAKVRWRLTSTLEPPRFHSFTDPYGRPVAGLRGGASVRSFRMPAGLPLGEYTLTFDAPRSGSASLERTVVPRRAAKRRVAKLSPDEPDLAPDGVTPTSAGRGGLLTVRAEHLVDPNVPRGRAGLALGTVALSEVTLSDDRSSVTGRIPDDLPPGRYDVIVTSTSGQPSALRGAFERLAAPVVDAIDPAVVPAAGGTEVVVRGRNFRAGQMTVSVNGNAATVTASDATSLRFTAPAHAAGTAAIAVRDLGSDLDTTVPSLEYAATPAVGRVSPPLEPVLGGDEITLDGAAFSPTDRVFLETTTAGVYEELTASQATYVDAAHHRFAAPPRPSGAYQVYVEDVLGRRNSPSTKSLAYFSFVDVTAESGFGTLVADRADATTSALADVDGDGDLDLVLSRSGGAAAAATSETRVFRNDGHGKFADVTSSTMPAAGADDWRADRVASADIDGDGFADLVLATNSRNVPPAGASHTRILLNEALGGTSADAARRVFRDRTDELMPPARAMRDVQGAGLFGPPVLADDWRALDLWVGDLDRTGPGPPEIVVTHDETKAEIGSYVGGYVTGVYCGNYCASGYDVGVGHVFYWGGTRTFAWDAKARGGRGRYRFDFAALPRAAYAFATYIPRLGGTFTPFTGKRLAVGDLDGDGKPDIAVLADHAPIVNSQYASALQVAFQGTDPSTGAKFTDVTAKLTAIGYDLSGDTLALGATSIATAWATRQPGRSMTLLELTAAGGATSFRDVTYEALPLPTAQDGLEASQIRFADLDQDGDQDILLVAKAPPSGGGSAFRALRNDAAQGGNATFHLVADALTTPLLAAGEHLEGDALAVGDVTGDGLLDYVITRRDVAVAGTETRIVSRKAR